MGSHTVKIKILLFEILVFRIVPEFRILRLTFHRMGTVRFYPCMYDTGV